jgi:hypothetical protein
MPAVSPENPRRPGSVHPMPGLEVDNLLSILALLGLLRSLEADKPAWWPRASWAGPPWVARLHVDALASEEEIAEAAAKGVERIASRFDVDSRKNVDFTPEEFRRYAERCRADPVRAALAAALTAEHPEKQGGGLRAAPLVMMFGQGHQNFLERLVAVALGQLPGRLAKSKAAPDLRDPRYVVKALFQPWKRDDDADGFRWDPEEDQRYALRFGDPSRAGAASTVHGANRLAALGLLSFPFAPSTKEPNVPAVTRGAGIVFVWPVWTEPLSRHGIERLMSHPDVLGVTAQAGRGEPVESRLGEPVRPSTSSIRAAPGRTPRDLHPLGVAEVYAARRVANGKFMNVTRGVPRTRGR